MGNDATGSATARAALTQSARFGEEFGIAGATRDETSAIEESLVGGLIEDLAQDGANHRADPDENRDYSLHSE